MDRAIRKIVSLPSGVVLDIHALHSGHENDIDGIGMRRTSQLFAPDSRNVLKIILATNVAESSITVTLSLH